MQHYRILAAVAAAAVYGCLSAPSPVLASLAGDEPVAAPAKAQAPLLQLAHRGEAEPGDDHEHHKGDKGGKKGRGGHDDGPHHT